MIAVANHLRVFIPEGHGQLSPLTSVERRLEMVNTQYWGGGTSAITALFLTEDKARQCFDQSGLEPCDPRWIEDTKQVLEAIGEEHPTISICHHDNLALMPS